jgi:hypothetical protein
VDGGGALEETETARARWERETEAVEAGWCLPGTASGGAGDLGKERKSGRGQAHAIGAEGAELSSPWRERQWPYPLQVLNLQAVKCRVYITSRISKHAVDI